ncbi:MAG: lytic transglycosylase domain-containing protein [bacterium]|nr:lytic transglycosylase domain-containing protein [bacterium]
MGRRIIKMIIALAILCLAFWFVLPSVQRLYFKLDYVEQIQEAADRYHVNPYWIAAMIKCESNFEPEAVSSAGAVGLMQIMPTTAEDIERTGLVDATAYSFENLTDPETNINFGTAYLRSLVERYHEMDPAIAAYNAGYGNVDKWLENDSDVRNSVEFRETKKYLRDVHRAKDYYETLYPDAFEWES